MEQSFINANMDAPTLVAWGGGIMTFVAALVGSFIAWRRSRDEDVRAKENHESTDAKEFRADLQEFSKTLMTEINGLRDRIRRLEDDVIEKNKMVLKLQNQIAYISRTLMHDHGINVEDMLKEAA